MMRTLRFKAVTAFVLALALCACAKGGQELLEEARQELAVGAFSEAVVAARAGLATAPSDVTTWGLELVILEAHSRAGNGAEAKGQLVKLAKAHPERISATDYSSTAQLLQSAEQKPVAIEVLDLGVKRFPDDAVLAKMIENSVASGSDPEELEMLRSLGYIE
jgi:ABC-type Fe3+-hydroxamate transport system substrate-binding protein